MNHTPADHLELVYEAAKQYKSTATLLMNELCEQASIDVNSSERNFHLREKYGKQKEHPLSYRWIFCLHGAEARFTNIDDDRTIEVIIINGNEFGVLDHYFFGSFCEQTPPYTSIAKLYQQAPNQFQSDMNTLLSIGKLRKVNRALPEVDRNVTT